MSPDPGELAEGRLPIGEPVPYAAAKREAEGLLPTFAEAVVGKKVRAFRNDTMWSGEVVAVSDGPAILIEGPNGARVMIPRDNTRIEIQHPNRPPSVVEHPRPPYPS